MAARSLLPRLTDIVESIVRIRDILGGMPLEAFEADWQKQWLIERGIEIISEACCHLPEELKARHPEIPWQKVAGIGMYSATTTKCFRTYSLEGGIG